MELKILLDGDRYELSRDRIGQHFLIFDKFVGTIIGIWRSRDAAFRRYSKLNAWLDWQAALTQTPPASTAAVAEALKCLMAARELIESIAIIQGMYAHAARQGRSYKAQALIEINDAIAALTKPSPSGTAGEEVV